MFFISRQKFIKITTLFIPIYFIFFGGSGCTKTESESSQPIEQ